MFFVGKKQKLANGTGVGSERREGRELALRCILGSWDMEEGRRGAGKHRCVVGWHRERLPHKLWERKEERESV